MNVFQFNQVTNRWENSYGRTVGMPKSFTEAAQNAIRKAAELKLTVKKIEIEQKGDKYIMVTTPNWGVPIHLVLTPPKINQL